jgi:hypothetical protein
LNQESNEYYCFSCIEKLHNYEEIKENVIPPSLLEEKLLEKLEIQCKNSDFGCTNVFNYTKIKELQKHEIDCETRYVKCPWKKCKAKLLKAELNEHLVSCEHVMIICSRCYQEYAKNTEKFHDCIPSLFKLLKKLQKDMYRKDDFLLKKIDDISNRMKSEMNESCKNITSLKEIIENRESELIERLNQIQKDIHCKMVNESKELEKIFTKKLEDNINYIREECDRRNNGILNENDNKMKMLVERISNDNFAFQEKIELINKDISQFNQKNNDLLIKQIRLESNVNELSIEKDKMYEIISSLKNNSIQEALNKLSILEEVTKSITNEISELSKPLIQSSKENKKALFAETIRNHPLLKDLVFSRKLTLIYKASENGFSANKFHELCDGIKNTITVVQSENGNIFGGYSPIAWNKSQKGYGKDISKKGFLFSITNSTKHLQFNHDQKSIYSDPDCGPTFGSGYDLHISNECNNNNSSFSRLGNTYKIKEGAKVETDDSKTYLAGSSNFKVVEYEVYKII